jgi:catechol 2,3-dioxygenase-like lactoylglutathione lyase family enzyme
MRFREVTLAGPPGLPAFYEGVLDLPLDADGIRIGETLLRFEPGDGEPFYHFALLVPGDRFDAALAWARERVELLGDVFASDDWGSRALYFHDPAGNILELIAHHALEENGRSDGFAAEELVGFSELGIVGDKPDLLRRLEAVSLQMWTGRSRLRTWLSSARRAARSSSRRPAAAGCRPVGPPSRIPSPP